MPAIVSVGCLTHLKGHFVSDSYFVAAEVVRRRVFADFAIAHLMSFAGGLATGTVVPSPLMKHAHGCPWHDHCKRNALKHVLEAMQIRSEQVLAVGDGENDICLLSSVGTSIAFRPRSARVRAAAQYCFHDSLIEILHLAEHGGREPVSELDRKRDPVHEAWRKIA